VSAAAAAEPLFNRSTLFWGVFASLLAAAGFFLLSTYAPDFRLGRDGGGSPLSKSGTGFAGLVKLMTLTGDTPGLARDADDLATDMLLVVTISPEGNTEALSAILEAREDLPTLFVLPKWQTVPLQEHPGWEMQNGRLAPYHVDPWLARIMKGVRIGTGTAAARNLDVDGRLFVAPAPNDLQWAESTESLISAGGNRAVLLEVPDRWSYVLTDPDLLNNAALKDSQRAAAALALIGMIRPYDDPVMFDLTLYGAGRKHDLAKLLIEPPFLALTLTILAAAALAVLHGLARFGPPQPDIRAIPFGKRALVDTTAMLMGRAGRLDRLGGRYAMLMRSRAAALLGAPPGLKGEALDQWLDSRDKDGEGGLAASLHAASRASNQASMVPAARRLHDWIARRLRGDRR
jgi:hypothetical protein